jgi:hypothetical protein
MSSIERLRLRDAGGTQRKDGVAGGRRDGGREEQVRYEGSIAGGSWRSRSSCRRVGE